MASIYQGARLPVLDGRASFEAKCSFRKGGNIGWLDRAPLPNAPHSSLESR